MSEGKSKGSSSGGIGFLGLLTIVFITLRLLGHIQWSWAWVLAPLWIPGGLGVVLLSVAGIYGVVKGWRLRRADARARRTE